MREKNEAACAAQCNTDFVLIARTDARADMRIEEASAGGKVCRKAGADVIFI
jgi:2-methylisocitrate lyase-like PEP mutase family enzyme